MMMQLALTVRSHEPSTLYGTPMQSNILGSVCKSCVRPTYHIGRLLGCNNNVRIVNSRNKPGVSNLSISNPMLYQLSYRRCLPALMTKSFCFVDSNAISSRSTTFRRGSLSTGRLSDADYALELKKNLFSKKKFVFVLNNSFFQKKIFFSEKKKT